MDPPVVAAIHGAAAPPEILAPVNFQGRGYDRWVEGHMSNEVTVMNWFFGITAGLVLLVGLSVLIYAKVKRRKIDRLPIFVILQVGYAVCATAIMNLRGKHEGLAIAPTFVEIIPLAISGPMVWKRFIKHLRDEGLIEKKRVN